MCEATTRIPLRVATRRKPGYEDIQFPLLDPHVLLHQLFTTVGLKIPASCVKEFWHFKRCVSKEAWALQSPASDEHIPLALYGDGVRLYSNQDVKMYGIWISLPLWRCSSSRCSRWCVAAIEHWKLYGSQTLDTIMERLTYSLNLLFKGFGPDGDQLCGGRKFTVTELKGDWGWHKVVFQFWSAWNRKDSVCFRCNATAIPGVEDAKLFWDETADWREFSLEQFLVAQLGHRERTCSWGC